ncbi:hypothetical protein CAC42_6460 [Sphaceloma murrayae]|uniref:Sequence orphan n=1 Tax=Sphaceloma murrayae TaxID=2082308 RepID=A0A2K1QNB5_9PEZI|nr:hypothetical protein CAC42_6460 [Sphaceloma murrayae]
MAPTTDLPDLGTITRLKERQLQKKGSWNTNNLAQRLLADGAAALSAGALVAPLITMIDKAIIENASGKRALIPSLQASFKALLLQPHRFLGSKPFLLILSLYSGTYLTANILDTTQSTLRNQPASSTTTGPSKFIATSTANLSLCLYKDSQFTRMFGTVSARPVPGPTYALFAARDCLTIFASFNLPPLLAPKIPLSEVAERYVSRTSVAQFLAPASVQLLSTPLHLLGLDLYNRNGGTSFRDRLSKVHADWLPSSFARMCRIIPAFGVGGVVNTGVRKGMIGRLQ